MTLALPKPVTTATGEPKEEWVTLPEATRLMRKHRQQVLTLIVRGELIADVRGRYTWVTRESVDRWLAANSK